MSEARRERLIARAQWIWRMGWTLSDAAGRHTDVAVVAQLDARATRAFYTAAALRQRARGEEDTARRTLRTAHRVFVRRYRVQ